MIAGLFSELLSVGGVQRAGRHLSAVLAEFAASQGRDCRFLSLNDPRGPHRSRLGKQDCAFQGCGRSKAALVFAALRLAAARPALILVGHPHLAPVGAAIRQMARSSKLAVVAHGVEVWEPLSGLRKWGLRKADLVLGPSSDTCAKLQAVQGLPDSRVQRLPWGLDPELYAAAQSQETVRPANGFPSGRVVLAVARLSMEERYKGVDTLIRAVARLQPRLPDLHLVTVGDGDQRSELEDLARALEVTHRVHFLGPLSGEVLFDCYRRCDAFALPSAGEGFGLVFLEAMAFGKPVIGGAEGGTPDVIADGDTGFLVPAGDVARLAAVLESLFTQDELRRQMGQRARERVEEQFLFEHFRARLWRVLEGLCES